MSLPLSVYFTMKYKQTTYLQHTYTENLLLEEVFIVFTSYILVY